MACSGSPSKWDKLTLLAKEELLGTVILMFSFPDPVCHMDAENLTLEQGRRFHNSGYEVESLTASTGYTAGVGYFENYRAEV